MAIFLDEFRMVLFSPTRTEDPPEFTFFNTLVPQDHPGNVRRLRFPQRFRQCTPVVTVDLELPLGALHRDGPFIADPTQALLVVRLWDGIRDYVFVIWRIQTLISHACSTDGNTHIPWDELGRATMTIEPSEDVLLLIQGVHAIEGIARSIPDDNYYLRLRIFDFSRRGSSLLPENGTEAEAALYEGGRDILLDGTDNMDGDWMVRSLGNGTFYRLVSCLSAYKTCGTLIPFEAPVYCFGPRVERLRVGLRPLFLVDDKYFPHRSLRYWQMGTLLFVHSRRSFPVLYASLLAYGIHEALDFGRILRGLKTILRSRCVEFDTYLSGLGAARVSVRQLNPVCIVKRKSQAMTLRSRIASSDCVRNT